LARIAAHLGREAKKFLQLKTRDEEGGTRYEGRETSACPLSHVSERVICRRTRFEVRDDFAVA
jgi:hypothetical protein